MAAHAGNKYALGNTGGRPPKFDTVEALEERIIDYFESLIPESIKRVIENEDGEEETIKEMQLPEPPTITGLALFLGFCDKKSLYDYRKKEEFSYSIRRALTVVENHYETTLNYKSPTGAIFALKNMDWADKTEVEHSGNLQFNVPSGKSDTKSDDIE